MDEEIAFIGVVERILRSANATSPPVRAGKPADVDIALSRICNGRWRRTSLDANMREHVMTNISNALSHGNSVKFSIPFGGYKNWMQPAHPSPCWAEVFCLSYLRSYFDQVAEVVPGGVDVAFTYCGHIMDIVSNMPLTRQATYITAFSRLLQFFSTGSVRFELVDTSTLYLTQAEMHREFRENVRRIAASWHSAANTDNRTKRIASAERNLVLNGIEDLRMLPPAELRETVVNSAILCEALDSLRLRRNFNKFGDRLQLVFVRGPSLSLHVGSSETSANHFWSGTGVLEMRRGRVRTGIRSAGALQNREDVMLLNTERLADALGIDSLSTLFCLRAHP